MYCFFTKSHFCSTLYLSNIWTAQKCSFFEQCDAWLQRNDANLEDDEVGTLCVLAKWKLEVGRKFLRTNKSLLKKAENPDYWNWAVSEGVTFLKALSANFFPTFLSCYQLQKFCFLKRTKDEKTTKQWVPEWHVGDTSPHSPSSRIAKNLQLTLLPRLFTKQLVQHPTYCVLSRVYSGLGSGWEEERGGRGRAEEEKREGRGRDEEEERGGRGGVGK